MPASCGKLFRYPLLLEQSPVHARRKRMTSAIWSAPLREIIRSKPSMICSNAGPPIETVDAGLDEEDALVEEAVEQCRTGFAHVRLPVWDRDDASAAG